MKQVSKIAIVALLLFAGCSTSRITSSWKAENIQSKEYKKVLVLGLMNESDRSLREKMEEHLVGDLKDLGYNAVCSCDEFNPKAFENMSEKQALDKLNNSGIDAVLTIVLLNKSKEGYYVPGRIQNSPIHTYRGRFWGYYSDVCGRIYSPGYYTSDTKYFWESNFYELSNGPGLLYSAQSQSFDPGSAQNLGHEYGQMIVKDMIAKNLLKKREEQSLKSF